MFYSILFSLATFDLFFFSLSLIQSWVLYNFFSFNFMTHSLSPHCNSLSFSLPETQFTLIHPHSHITYLSHFTLTLSNTEKPLAILLIPFCPILILLFLSQTLLLEYLYERNQYIATGHTCLLSGCHLTTVFLSPFFLSLSLSLSLSLIHSPLLFVTFDALLLPFRYLQYTLSQT